jgi:hypothetical protein
VHPIRGDEMRALRKLRREHPTDAYVFVSERGGPMSPIGFHRLIQRLGEAAKMPFHTIPTCCGTPVDTSSPTTDTTRERCNTISATRISSTPCATPRWQPIGSVISGGKIAAKPR